MPPQNPSNPSSCSSPCQVPIQESLIEFPDGSISKLATEAFQGRKPQTPCPVGPPSLEKGLDKQIGWLLQPHRPPCSNLGGWGVCHTSPGWGRGELRHRVPFFPPAVMKFMGDHPPRGQTELDIVCTLLKVNPVPWGWWQRGRPRLWSEPCVSPSCARSTRRCGTRCTARSSSSSPTTPAPSRESCWAGTAQPGWFWGQFSTLTPRGHPGIWGRPHPAVPGRSPGLRVLFQPPPCSAPGGSAPNFPCRDSCQKGWRLLYILTAYYRCSEVLRPFLLAFLQGASGRPELPFHGRGCAHPGNL